MLLVMLLLTGYINTSYSIIKCGKCLLLGYSLIIIRESFLWMLAIWDVMYHLLEKGQGLKERVSETKISILFWFAFFI